MTVGADSGTSSAGVTGGVGTLSDAIAFANAQSGPVTIDIETNVTLSGPHSPIPNANVTINGGNKAITSTTQRILFVGTDTGSKRASDSAFKGHVDVSFW